MGQNFVLRPSVLMATVWLALSGCAVTSVRDTNKIRSAEELAELLLTEEDLSGDWTLNMGPDGAALPASGVITDVEREMLPQVELCAEAGQAALDAIDSLKWQGFRQLDRVVDDPIDPPADREGHMEFAQQFLMSADPDDLESAFSDVATGYVECLGDVPAGEEGPGTITEVEIEPVGDQRIATLAQIEEAGGGGMWNIYSVLVRKGAVLMSITAVDIVLGELEMDMDLTDLNAMLSAASSKI
jgi:hypothetical protein